MDKYKYRTALSPCEEMIKSEYGEITYLEWCGKEVERINNNGGNAELIKIGLRCAVK